MPLLGLNNVLLAATCAATIYAGMTSRPVWTASAQLNLPQTGNSSASQGTLGNIESSSIGISKELNPLQVQSAILTSDFVLNRLWAADPEKSLYTTLSTYKELFRVEPQVQSTIIVLQAEGSSPELARKRVATLIESYQQRLNELRRNETEIRQRFAQEGLEKARNNLTQAQNNLSKFQQSTGITDRDRQTQELITAIGGLKTTQATVMAEAQANETQAKVAAARLGMTPQQAMNSLRLAENQEYQVVRGKLSEVETALAAAKSTYTEQSPQVQSLLVQRQELLRELNQRQAVAVPGATEGIDTTLSGNGSEDSRIGMIAELIRAETAARGLEQQAVQLQNQRAKLSTELASISKNQAQLADLQRQFEVAEGVHRGIIAQIEQAKTSPFNAYPNVQTLNEATINPKPIEPKLWPIALGGILASIFGSIALILFLEARKPLLSPKDLQQVEFPILGRISRIKRLDRGWELGADIEIDFQRLASAVSCLEKHRLMVTSASFGEGKTTVTLGLALALVNFGFRVLVVDGDLRQAELSRRLGYPQSEIKARLKQTPISVHPGLDLMPAPLIPKNKIGEFFARGSFERSLSTIEEAGNYDYVLVDSAPVGLASETTLMSEVVRNVLFVVRPGNSDRYSVMDSFEQLIQHNAQIMGLVVNGVESRTEGYRYGRQRELLEAEA